MADGTDIDPQALEALVERMDADTDQERDGDLQAMCEIAWPTLEAQNG